MAVDNDTSGLKQEKLRLRFAPSPTGYLHVGGARTALFNYLFARAHGGTFILRIEDTDQKRSTKEATEQLLSSLVWLGCDWDEGPAIEIVDAQRFQVKRVGEKGKYGPYLQSMRLSRYNVAIEKLIAGGKAYPCVCSDDELEQKRKNSETLGVPYVYDQKCYKLSDNDKKNILSSNQPYTVRFHVENKEILVEDLVKGEIRFDTNLIGDFIIRKSDGFPTYNFAVVVDDAEMKITHVLRGDDHLSNTPRQIVLFAALGYRVPKFAHIAMILGEDRQKLSKRDGAISVLDFAQQGYYADPMINHLALLGWSPSDGVELLSRQALLKSFKSMKFSTSPAVFHHNKLDYFNGLHIRSMPAGAYLQDVRAFLLQSRETHTGAEKNVLSVAEGRSELWKNLLDYYDLQNFSEEDLSLVLGEDEKGIKELPASRAAKLLLALRAYCHKIADIEKPLKAFFSPGLPSPDVRKWGETDNAKKLFKLAASCFQLVVDGKKTIKPADSELGYVSVAEFRVLMKRAKIELGIVGKNFFMPLRVKLTGSDKGLELDVLFALLKRTDVIARLKSDH